jgi:hypothetical protein
MFTKMLEKIAELGELVYRYNAMTGRQGCMLVMEIKPYLTECDVTIRKGRQNSPMTTVTFGRSGTIVRERDLLKFKHTVANVIRDQPSLAYLMQD